MSRPTTCRNCGAPLDAQAALPVACRFCDAVNDAGPSQVEVPVPVQIVHNVVNVVGAPSGSVELRCPHCRKRLVGVRVGEVELHGCGRCGGIWVDNPSARSLVASPQRVVIELAERASANASRNDKVRSPTPACPKCDAVLERTRSHGIDIDVCGEHGTWFDSYELQMLVRSLLGEAPGRRKAVDPNASVTCVGCKQPLPASRANIGPDGPTCDACWRGHQASLVAQAEQQHQGVVAAASAVLLLGAIGAGLAGSRRS